MRGEGAGGFGVQAEERAEGWRGVGAVFLVEVEFALCGGDGAGAGDGGDGHCLVGCVVVVLLVCLEAWWLGGSWRLICDSCGCWFDVVFCVLILEAY